MDEVERELFSTTDAEVWAKHFQNVVERDPDLIHDKGFLIGWFANAIERGRDVGRSEERGELLRLLDDTLNVLHRQT